jgi:RNA polymerase sigma factor (sigma-70 family)
VTDGVDDGGWGIRFVHCLFLSHCRRTFSRCITVILMSADLTAQLVDNHRQFLTFLERRLGDRALAEDILQDAFVKSIEKGDDLRDESSAVAWFYRLLRNAVIDHYRRTGTRNRALEGLARELEGAFEPPQELQEAICGCVSRLASTLKPEYEQAIRRIEVDGASVQEYAAEASISANNAAVRVFRAREALRKQVKASCRTCADHGCLDCTCGSKKSAESHPHH